MAAGYKLPPPNSVAESLGYSEPGALLLPVSVRAPHTVYQSVGLIAYSEQLVVTTYTTAHSRVEAAPAITSDGVLFCGDGGFYGCVPLQPPHFPTPLHETPHRVRAVWGSGSNPDLATPNSTHRES